MAIYHFSAKVISRAVGSSAVAAAAYRSADRLHDERLGRHHDFTNKAGVVHSEVLLPTGPLPPGWSDREQLWNHIEAVEIRKDAQLAREVEFAIPREMSEAEGIALARDFVQVEFVDRGMIADLNVHWDIGADGLAKPHAHVMLTMREIRIGEDGSAEFCAKVRDWNRTELLSHWREAWADHVNERLASLDIDARVDHRTLEAQGIDLEPQHKIGPAASRMAEQGLEADRLAEHVEIARSNGEKLLADPGVALDAITHRQATFTNRDLAMFVHRHSDGKEQFDAVMSAVKGSPELIALGKDGRGEDRFTSRSMIETEERLERATQRLARTQGIKVPATPHQGGLDVAATTGLRLGREQQAALAHITGEKNLAIVVGYAGTGKSAMLGVAREAWEHAGLEVRGAALSGIAAEGLEHGSGIRSRTLASLEQGWSQGRDLLTPRDVLVIDEAGMVGTRQMERVVSHAADAGAKVVLVGDPEQLQAIEAGAAFRSAAERHGAVEIMDIRRQQEDWQREATRELATGRTGEAIGRYAEAGFVHVAGTREAARAELVDAWERDRQQYPDASRIILTHTNDEVRALNEEVRDRLRAGGALREEVTLAVDRGERAFAPGDRIMFLKNERAMGVKNGSLGTIQNVDRMRMVVMLDDGRSVAFDVKDYAQIDHGYAATIHKAQGMTVDRAQVLATPGMDRHSAYVAMSRHRSQVDVHYGRDDFASQAKLVRTLGRERGKDMASDYRVKEHAPAAEPKRSMFAGLKLKRSVSVEALGKVGLDRERGVGIGKIRISARALDRAAERSSLDKAVERYARAERAVARMHAKGFSAIGHQRKALEVASRDIDALKENGSRDLAAALRRDPSLTAEAANGHIHRALQAMRVEREHRLDAPARADRFVADWQVGSKELKYHKANNDHASVKRVGAQLNDMAKSLHRDPQLESLLRNRTQELGLKSLERNSVSQALQDYLRPSRSLGIEL